MGVGLRGIFLRWHSLSLTVRASSSNNNDYNLTRPKGEQTIFRTIKLQWRNMQFLLNRILQYSIIQSREKHREYFKYITQMFQYVPRKQREELLRTEEGNIIMNQNNLRLLCLKDGLYEYPELNTKLYLHFKSINKIQNLQAYKHLKAIYLENNLITKIQNIGCLEELESLFLHNNMITKIQNINCPILKILNLSGNQIHKIEGLDHLRQLQSLTLSKNFLKTFESIDHLGICSDTITNIDLSDNQIELDERMIPLFSNAKCLYMNGNPFVKDMKFYRRRMVAELPMLTYLDQKGVDQEQKLKAVAWLKEGDEGLKKVKTQIDKLRSIQKAEQSKQLMKDIDFHRQKKINLFKSAIEDCKGQIKKYISMSATTNMKDFYMNKIQQEQQKINTFYDSIIDIQKRMGKNVITERQVIQLPRLQQNPERVLDFPGLQSLILQQSTDGSSQPRVSSQQGSEHSEGHSVVRYDELD